MMVVDVATDRLCPKELGPHDAKWLQNQLTCRWIKVALQEWLHCLWLSLHTSVEGSMLPEDTTGETTTRPQLKPYAE